MFVPLLDTIALVKLTVFLLQVSPGNAMNWNFLLGGKLLKIQPPLDTLCLITQCNTLNRLTPNDPYMGRTAPLTSKRCILYIYSTNIGTE